MNRYTKAAGLILASVASGYFVIHAHRALDGKDLSILLNGKVLAAMATLTLLYSASILTTGAAWSLQLRAMHQPHQYPRFLAILAITQFGKYLPGNVGQHIGRVALAGNHGVGLGAAILSVGYELLLALVASAHIAAIALLLNPPPNLINSELLRHRWLLLGLVMTGAAGALALAPHVAAWFVRLRAPSGNEGPPCPANTLRLDVKTILASYSMYASGVAIIGIGVWLVAQTVVSSGVSVPSAFFFIGAFACSWILGFAAPGAPAGLGVREAALSVLLSSVMPATEVVVLVVALRIATTVGDLLNFCWGSALLMRMK